MNSVVRALGKVLRLVGISSPEDTMGRPGDASKPPSWKDKKDAAGGRRSGE